MLDIDTFSMLDRMVGASHTRFFSCTDCEFTEIVLDQRHPDSIDTCTVPVDYPFTLNAGYTVDAAG